MRQTHKSYGGHCLLGPLLLILIYVSSLVKRIFYLFFEYFSVDSTVCQLETDLGNDVRAHLVVVVLLQLPAPLVSKWVFEKTDMINEFILLKNHNFRNRIGILINTGYVIRNMYRIFYASKTFWLHLPKSTYFGYPVKIYGEIRLLILNRNSIKAPWKPRYSFAKALTWYLSVYY